MLLPPGRLAALPSSIHEVPPDRDLVLAFLKGRPERGAAAAGASVSAVVHFHFMHVTGQPVRDHVNALASGADGVDRGGRSRGVLLGFFSRGLLGRRLRGFEAEGAVGTVFGVQVQADAELMRTALDAVGRGRLQSVAMRDDLVIGLLASEVTGRSPP